MIDDDDDDDVEFIMCVSLADLWTAHKVFSTLY